MTKTTALDLPSPLARLGQYAAWLCVAAALAWPVLALVAVWPLAPADLLRQGGLQAPSMQGWGGPLYAHGQRVALAVVLVAPALAGSVALGWLAAGFQALGQGAERLAAACRALRGFAGWTLAAMLVSVAATPLGSVLLTLNHPAGERSLSVALSSHHLQALLTAALVWMFAHLLLRARAIADENAQFV